MTTPCPAVIVRGQANGLGVVRSLARGRIPTIVLDTTFRHAAMWSRWARPLKVDQVFGRRFVDDLLKLQATLGVRPVLILADEMAVKTVSEYREELEPCYRFHMPAAAMVATLANKALFHRFAERHELPVPRTLIVERESDIVQLSSLRFPLIAKPADKAAVHLARAERANRIGTLRDAERVCRGMLTAAGGLVVQEWVEGPDSEIYFCLFHCDQANASKHVFFGRKLASHPPRVGSTAVCVGAPETAGQLLPLVEKFLDIAEYQGLGSLEFKWDAQERRFAVIEPTVGRTDTQEEIATLNGVNLPLVAYCSELGLPPPATPRVGAAAWCELFRHRGSCARLDAGVHVYDAYWRIDDPMPAFASYTEKASNVARRLIRRSVLDKARPPVRRKRIA